MKTKIKTHFELIGRDDEMGQIGACLSVNRNVILEGPVGVGKTHLALAAARSTKRRVFRVDGDSRYTEQKLTGWFDPPLVLKKGYSSKSFMAGPLVEAMQSGGILFINELNRLPEGVQNVLLPAIDEKIIQVPRLGEISAQSGFQVIATQNPKEFVATSHLSEAILDRFDVIYLDYQSESDESDIVRNFLKQVQPQVVKAAVQIARLTRTKKEVRRGASVRAAIGIAELTQVFLQRKLEFGEAFLRAVLLALPTRVEFEREHIPSELLKEWVEEILSQASQSSLLNQKKK